MDYYQPIPFEGYNDNQPRRKDCEIRYKVIKEDYGDFSGKSLIDIGCANGYFGFRFLQDGGDSVHGVEMDIASVNVIREIAKRELLNFTVTDYLPSKKFDIGLYLDLHFHEDIENYYIDYLTENCGLVYCSPSGDGLNEKFEKVLKERFRVFTKIHEGFSHRNIYRCEK